MGHFLLNLALTSGKTDGICVKILP